MSDFLFVFSPRQTGSGLLELIKRPYGETRPTGRSFEHTLGCLAILRDQPAGGVNIVEGQGVSGGWVGDLVVAGGEKRLQETLRFFDAEMGQDPVQWLRSTGLLDRLNGAFASVIATDAFVATVTDPMASVQVYLGSSNGQPVAVGTHPDLVARCSAEHYDIDPVSVCDFMNAGISCCPHTMHRNVMELDPGSVHVFARGVDGRVGHRIVSYWTPPDALAGRIDERGLEDEFIRGWRSAVTARCRGDRVGVQLSGGLDSRLVMAVIPDELSCSGLTLCDSMNREARIARKVARAYGREWIALRREEEYLARTVMPGTRFTGCEGEWHHGHCILFAPLIEDLDLSSVFSGLLMDNNFKGYYAKDLVRMPRMRGLLGADYRVDPVDYVQDVSDFCRQNVRPTWVEGTLERRRAFYEDHMALRRESPCEWLDGFPYSQASDNTGWVIERRVMPLRLPVMDRSLLDLAFRIPIRLKAGGRFFGNVAARILGPGARIHNANDGVRPGSVHSSRLVQRAVRKTEDGLRKLAPHLGVRLQVPHSWHDFQSYWRESPALEALRHQHGANLQEFADVFETDPQAHLFSKTIHFEIGNRLVQLAAWISILEEYRA